MAAANETKKPNTTNIYKTDMHGLYIHFTVTEEVISSYKYKILK